MILLKDLLVERKEDWCSNEQFLELVDYLEMWQSHATYRRVNISELVKAFEKLPREIKRKITASKREVANSYSAFQMEALYHDNKVKVASFTNKRGAEYFSKQVSGEPVISGEHIKSYELAISYPKIVQLCGNIGLGDDEKEILVIGIVFDQNWVDNYWEEWQEEKDRERNARKRKAAFRMQMRTAMNNIVREFGFDVEEGEVGQILSVNEPLIGKAYADINELSPDKGISEDEVEEYRKRVLQTIDGYFSKAESEKHKRFFNQLKSELRNELRNDNLDLDAIDYIV